MIQLYRHIVNSLNGEARETSSCSWPLTERHLQILWLEQKLLKNLITNQGESIEVISPGIWNTGPGPDFLKAHLKIGNCEINHYGFWR